MLRLLPSMRDGREADGLGAGVDDSFLFEFRRLLPGFLFIWEQKMNSWFSRWDGFILPDLCHVYLDESSSEIESNHCSFDGYDFPF